MSGFTKLFPELLRSTVWVGQPASQKLVWIVLLAQADDTGRVMTSIPGLAKDAEVSVQEAEAAIRAFLEPDPYSRTPDFDGRRIERVDGGFVLLNHGKYRWKRDDDARREYKAEWARRRRELDKRGQSTVSTKVDSGQSGRLSSKAEAEAEAVIKVPSEPCRAAPAELFQDGEKRKADDTLPAAREVLAFLNRVTSRKFEDVKANLEPIRVRLREVRDHYDVDTARAAKICKAVVMNRQTEWGNDEKMRQHVCPQTIFRQSNFHKYAAAARETNPGAFEEKQS